MPDRRTAAREQRPDLRGKRILIVEDEPIIALALEDMIEAIGCVVVGIASAVPRALELVGESAPDVAILDVNLQGSQSYPVADALSDRGIRFVFATGYGDTEHPERHRDAPTLSKPYTAEEVRSALEAAAGVVS